MKKLLVALSFLGTGAIVGGVTLPTIVSCVPITHTGILKAQIEKDYIGINSSIKEKYNAMSPEEIQSAFMSFAFPRNKKMNMTHGYDVMQWSPILTYTPKGDNTGFDRSLIKMSELKELHDSDTSEESIENKKMFMIYDETLRTLANDFNKYKSLFRGFYEKSFVEEGSKETEWTGQKTANSITINLKNIYNELNLQFKTGKTDVSQIFMEDIGTLSLNTYFENAIALIVSFKNSSLKIQSDDQSEGNDGPVQVKEDGILKWVNEYWKYSYKLGFLPGEYDGSNSDYTDEIIRTKPMEVLRTNLFDQSINPTKSKYYDLTHDINIDEYLDTEELDGHDLRWMNPKDLLDYFSSIINPMTIYGLSNKLLRVVKDKKEIIQEKPKINLRFSEYLINNIYFDHTKFVTTKNVNSAQFGGSEIYTNNNQSDTIPYRFLSASQLDLVLDYKNVSKIK
ncbi:hypothetical protein [Spiroplasma endosymbiont of Othius punctulatus]|uniref:hypothetical protein n=1 Tax=Spiroplasma endosymbiont of Othius punctulatus TaxID=3066289 RepID=UPI0030D0EE25